MGNYRKHFDIQKHQVSPQKRWGDVLDGSTVDVLVTDAAEVLESSKMMVTAIP